MKLRTSGGRLRWLLFAGAMAAGAQSGLHAELPSKPVLTLEAAKKVADAAQAEAVKRGATVVIAVTCSTGRRPS
jgi:hypothetical protein